MNNSNFNLTPILIVILLSISACTNEDHGHDEMSPEEMEQHIQEVHTDESGNVIYTCSMHPEVRLNEPGSCPICGMDLIEVQNEPENSNTPDESGQMNMDTEESSMQEGDSMGGALSISLAQQQLIGMQYDTVKSRLLTKQIRSIGRLTHAEPNITEVVSRVGGYVEEAHVTETGVHVHKGQELITVYSPELVSAQEDYLVALRGSNPGIATRARERLRLLNMPDSEIQRIEENNEVLMRVTLVAPETGHIMVNNVYQGMSFEPGKVLYRQNDHSLLWLLADIYEEDLPFISPGQDVTFTVEGRPEERYEGTVTFIPPAINPDTRTLQARVEVPNPDFTLKMAQYARVEFNENLGNVLSVHKDAVLLTGERAVVFRETAPGQFAPVDVRLGPLAGNYYTVIEGLSPGDRVVTSGRFFLDAESRLRGTSPMAGHQH